MITPRGTVLSPCVAVCIINTETKFCMGCYRTIEEIGGWMLLDNDQRMAVLEELKQRRAADPDAVPQPKPKSRRKARTRAPKP